MKNAYNLFMCLEAVYVILYFVVEIASAYSIILLNGFVPSVSSLLRGICTDLEFLFSILTVTVNVVAYCCHLDSLHSQ